MVPEPPSLDVEALLGDQPWVERLARGLVRDSSLAADLAQETWLAAARTDPSARRGALRPFLAGILRHLHGRLRRSELRRARREGLAARPEALPSTAELAERAELQRLLVEGVLALPEVERRAILLRYFEGLPAEEIARRSGEPSATVRSRVYRGLAQLRERLEQRLPRRDVLGGLLPLVRVPEGQAVPVATAASLPLLGGVLVMKAAVKMAAVCVVLATLGAGFWMLERGESAARESGKDARDDEEVAVPLSVTERPPAGLAVEREPSPAARSPVEAARKATGTIGAERSARTPSIAGRAVDPRGIGVADVVLEEAHGQERRRLGTSGHAGDFRCELSPLEEEISVTLEFVHPGHARRSLLVRAAPGAEIHLGEIGLVPAGRLAGRVEDPSGHRVSGARVIAARLENARTDPEVLRRQGPKEDDSTVAAVSTADGSFRLEGVPAGSARVWVGAEGFSWSSFGPLEVAAGDELLDVRLVLGELRREDRITGVVLDPRGEPVAGASILAWYTAARTGGSLTASTDGRGRFELPLEHRVVHDLSVQDSQQRWSEAYVLDVEPGTEGLVIRFRAERWIDVVVTDAEDRPIERYGLDTESADPGRRTLWMYARHAPPTEGCTRLRVPEAPFRVTASARGYESAEQGPFDPESPPAELFFALAPLPGIHGRVLTSEGEPAARTRVSLVAALEGRELVVKDGFRLLVDPYEKADETTADGDGRFTLYPGAAGEYVVEAEADGHALTVLGPRRFDPRSRVELEIELVKGGSIEGRALAPEGMEPEGIVIVFNRGDGRLRTLRTGPRGEYRMEGLTPGPWEVRASEHDLDPERSTISHVGKGGDEPWEWSCGVVDRATTRFDVDLSSWAPGTVEGRFVLAGVGAQGWSASLERIEGPWTREVACSEPLAGDGEFRLGPVRPGEWTLVLRGPEEGHGRLEVMETLEVVSGANAWDLELETGRLEGSGATPRGDRERFHEYRWERVSRGRELSARVRIVPAGDGRFVLPVVPAGAATIQRNDPPGEGQKFARWEVVARLEVVGGGVERVELP
jgi:RNA polymerase sigma-70 factor (ECF subfamily)